MLADIAFILCAITSFVCFLLLFRAYRHSRSRFLFWSSLCFLGFAANNALLYVDVRILPPPIDLSVVRTLPALAGVCCLIYGLIREMP